MTHSVSVLLSVTDQAVYLDEFMTSLAAQRDVEVKVAVRTDRAEVTSAVKDALRRFEPFVHEQGPALGLPDTYLRLIGTAPLDSDFYAFADQDDLWDPDKLKIACESLLEVGSGAPALWICGYTPFESGRSRTRRAKGNEARVEPSFRHALVENIAPGCTMVWNKALQEILASRIPASGVLMHDYWVYLVAAALGEILVEPRKLVNYRIHDGNAIGIKRSMVDRSRRFVRTVRSGSPTMETQAAAFLDQFGDRLRPEDHGLCHVLAFGRSTTRARYALTGRFQRARSVDRLLLAARLLYPARRMHG
jgi:hypothetical protein